MKRALWPRKMACCSRFLPIRVLPRPLASLMTEAEIAKVQEFVIEHLLPELPRWLAQWSLTDPVAARKFARRFDRWPPELLRAMLAAAPGCATTPRWPPRTAPPKAAARSTAPPAQAPRRR